MASLIRLFEWRSLTLYAILLALLVLGSKLVFVALGLLQGNEALRYSDFFVFWSAAQIMAQDGAIASFDQVRLNFELGNIFDLQALQATGLNTDQFWLYPPTILPWIAPLSLTSPAVGLAFYYVISLAVWVFVVAKYFPKQSELSIFPVLFAPIVFVNYSFEQNGIFSAALLIAIISILRFRGSAIWLGMLSALLLFKPTLGLLIPIAFLLERRWDAFAWATLFCTAYLGAVTAIWGIEYWNAFFAKHAAHQSLIEAGLFAQYAISGYGFLQSLGISHNPALGLHAALAILMLVAFFIIWRRGDWALKAASFLIIAPLLSSYANIYDFVTSAFAIGLLYPIFQKWRWGSVVLGLYWIAPMAFRPDVNVLGALEMPILNIAMVGLLTWIAMTQYQASSSASQ